MPVAATYLALLLGICIVALAAQVLALRFGLRLATASDATLRRTVLVFLIVFSVQISTSIFLNLVSATTPFQQKVLLLFDLLLSIGLPIILTMRFFGLGLFRAIQAWLPVLAVSALTVILFLFVFRPFLFETYLSPTNSMCPTLLGTHRRGSCPECEAPGFYSPGSNRRPRAEQTDMICENFHVADKQIEKGQTLEGDRFVVAKLVKPRRWDIIAFRAPENPETIYVARHVGLPGESIEIRNGAVFIDGQRPPLPDSLTGLKYDPVPSGAEQMWGTSDNPAELGDDEFFVLGDFSTRAWDSRYWQQGAPGHPSYAVPEANLVGVVALIYWPPKRWRAFR